MSDKAPVLQYINQDSAVHRMDSLCKFIWLLVVAIGMLTFRSLVSGGTILAGVLGLAFVFARIPLKTIVRSAPILFGVGLMLGVFHSIIQPGNPILTLGPISIKDNGVIIGISYFFRISTVVLASYMLIWTTNVRELMTGLNHIGIPYQFGFGVFTALRFLPLIQREIEAVSAAHSIRGRVKQTQLADRFQLWQRYVFTIMVNGLRKAEFAATAAQLRGFGISSQRTSYKPFQWSKTGLVMLGIFLVLIVGLHICEQVFGPQMIMAITSDLTTR
ncbi:MAG TPA: energy-coupling factor transporter transmembrane component T [Anaerolineaceae bacterium]|nr:energy-coupling factor transporter transmembrane component T [Anaerolineaceae bacterium]